ncbi:serine/threonine protein kinase [Paenibacillus sp. MWE-103]|uniref:Serine/threonine protein kinase n=1 Tax=Paenibacillus artemisiicola TaxID=1172618 RepID=A0ABS3WCK4_9BACL|nr:serine/threonine-protein kinase [Paenibacillus artemisiicola]MBO7746034.1 serine/threonine protein kinase [Paenibacillus artemisiicola]
MNKEREEVFASGTLIGGRYRIHGLIGKGGMGEVYTVEDTRLHGKIRALKANRPGAGTGFRGAEEAALLMRLNHPHLPLIVDYFPAEEHDGCELMVMDYIDGMTLQAYAERQGGVVPAASVVEIGLQLAEALHYLHGQRPAIIHRDLKPTNVMMDRGGFVRLIDFGIAREFKPGQAKDTVTLGTPGFAAPEQEGDRQSDARTDVYGLGALLYYLLAGGIKLGRGPAGGDAPIMGGLLGGPQALVAVIARMTDPVPALRYPSMVEARQALAACQNKRAADAADRQPLAAHGRQAASRRLSVVVASLSPGAGATFTAITLGHLLDRPPYPPAAAVEHPALEPEWHALLPDAGKGRAGGRLADSPDRRYAATASPSGRTIWYRLEPAAHAAAGQDAELQLKHRLMLQAIEAPIVLTDVSSRWLSPEMAEQLASCDMLLFVADPFPAKWTIERLAAAKRICGERELTGRSTYWIANKDGKFGARGDWLAAMPAKPGCSLPLLPAEAWADQIWSGKWATAHRTWQPLLERSLQPVLQAISASV